MASQLRPAIEHAAIDTLEVRLAMPRPVHRILALAPTATGLPLLLSDQQSLEWPRRVGTIVTVRPSGCVLCIGPAEWLAIDCEHVLRSAARADTLAVVELSDGTCEIELHGRAVEDLLMSACGLDLCASIFPPQCCARTRFAGVAVVIVRQRVERFSGYVARSHLSYVLAVLREHAQGVPGARRFTV